MIKAFSNDNREFNYWMIRMHSDNKVIDKSMILPVKY